MTIVRGGYLKILIGGKEINPTPFLYTTWGERLNYWLTKKVGFKVSLFTCEQIRLMKHVQYNWTLHGEIYDR